MSYPEPERTRLLDAAAEVLLATVASDRTGVIAYYREIMAAGRFLYDAQRKYADNQLLQALFARQERLPEDDSDQHEELTRERLMDRLDQIGQIVHDDEEGRQFKQFLYDLAVHVAHAHGGIFAPRVSEGEAAFLSDLQQRLRLPGGDA
jgi:hypothetical protein